MSIILPDDDGFVIAPTEPISPFTNWYNVNTPEEVERVEHVWADAPTDNLDLCDLILGTAREQVIAYASVPPEGEGYPRRMVYAQLQQARNLWNAGSANSDGGIGSGDYSFTPRPLDKTIRSIIRPTSGVPDVF